MTYYLRIAFVSSILFLIAGSAKAKNIFHVMIQKPASIQAKSFQFTYDDGLEVIAVTDTFIGNQLSFSREFFSTFATLKISYTDNDGNVYFDRYFLGKKPAIIVFPEKEIVSGDGFFNHSKLENVVEIYQSKIKKKRNEFCKKETSEMSQFWAKNGNVWNTDSIKNLHQKLYSNLYNKDAEFVKNNGSDYYSFWLFRTQVLPGILQDNEAGVKEFSNLLDLYNTTFPAAFKNTTEGKRIIEILTGRINTRKNQVVPNFKLKDIEGNLIKFNEFRGKYILLDFWATWCPPCMKERPFIKKIRQDYPADKLIIIGMSDDRDYKRFESVIKEYSMNCIHIFGNKEMLKIFGVDAIPATFLIDKDGILIYDGKGEGQEVLIDLLNKM
jgi:thiol-disulfide isomerase/thioredoxin